MLATGLIGASGVAIGSRWLQTQKLHIELESLRMEAGELVRLRAANATLKGQQISAVELEALRADHAALPRLRAEIEALKKGLGEGAAGSAGPAGR